jgi:hypothetical protein
MNRLGALLALSVFGTFALQGCSSDSDKGSDESFFGGAGNASAGRTNAGRGGGTTGGRANGGRGGAASATGGVSETGGSATQSGGAKSGGAGGTSETGGVVGTGGAKSGRGGSGIGGKLGTGGKVGTGTGGASTLTGGSAGAPASSGDVYGAVHEGQYHLGPVDFAQTDFFNACGSENGYLTTLRDSAGLGGEYLAGVDGSFADGGAVCDACIVIKTALGHSIVARVVTYGEENDPGDFDVSQSVFDTITEGEYPRSASWQFTKCPASGTLRYEFQSAASEWWTSLWVRNARVPLTKVEVKSKNHADFVELERGTDGSLTDGDGFGAGAFTLRMTGMDGQVVTETIPSFEGGDLIVGTQQFE